MHGVYIVAIIFRRQAVRVSADDIILTDIANDHQGQLTFNMIVQVNNGMTVLMASDVQGAVEASIQYSDTND